MIEQLKTSDLAEVFQRFVKDFARVLEENPRLDGRMIKDIELAAATPIDHKLGRVPVGWEMTDITYTGIGPIEIRRAAWDDKTITLESVGIGITPTIAIWVY